MTYFSYHNDQLYCERVPLNDIALQYGTPCYVYSQEALTETIQAYLRAVVGTRIRVCYAVKANSNLSILKIIANHQMGFDIVSIGELERVLIANGDPKKIIFSGVGKRRDEIIRAIEVGIDCFDVESLEELIRLNTIAKEYNKIIQVALRVNPNVDAETHKHISTGLEENKFGIHFSDVLPISEQLSQCLNIRLKGLAFHIGSQLTQLKPLLTAMDKMIELVRLLRERGFSITSLNVGGGLGVSYHQESPPTITEYISAIQTKVAELNIDVIVEPGRSLVATTGILLTRVEYLKSSEHKHFAIIDAAMNDLIRPALYDAWHDIISVEKKSNYPTQLYDIVGPVCETADYLGHARSLAIAQGSLLAILNAGAYGFCMSSNYNSRPRAAEVMVDQTTVHIIRKREKISDLYQLEWCEN